jgi:hypothetical protein
LVVVAHWDGVAKELIQVQLKNTELEDSLGERNNDRIREEMHGGWSMFLMGQTASGKGSQTYCVSRIDDKPALGRVPDGVVGGLGRCEGHRVSEGCLNDNLGLRCPCGDVSFFRNVPPEQGLQGVRVDRCSLAYGGGDERGRGGRVVRI